MGKETGLVRVPDKTKKLMTRKTKMTIFIVLMLAYPVAHFLINWVFVNFNSIMLTFKKFVLFPNETYPETGWHYAGFANYKNVFEKLWIDPSFRKMILNSFSYLILACFINLPLAILISFVLFKKVPLGNAFRVIFFLPSIIPLVVMTLAYESSLNPLYGYIPKMISAVGLKGPVWFGSPETSQVSIWLFMIWSGLGYNVILLSSAMARLPKEILEYGKLEGISGLRELTQIFIPLVWSTVTTVFVLGLMSVFTVALQPMFLSGNLNRTIGLEIFSISQAGSNLEYAATLGIICTIFMAPVILGIRHLMERCFKDVDF